MTTILYIQNIIERYKNGYRYFVNLDFDKGEKLTGQLLVEATFENCYFSLDFSQTDFTNTKFKDCNLKCCDFSECNLTNTIFENCTLEGTEFANAKVEGTTFHNCYYFGQVVFLDKETRTLQTFKDPLVKELSEIFPEIQVQFSSWNDRYHVYDIFGKILLDDITSNDKITGFTLKCFEYLNLLGERNDNSIDNLLIVGIYEVLYPIKKCNDIAQSLLTGRNKDVYEYWMKNGSIRAEY